MSQKLNFLFIPATGGADRDWDATGPVASQLRSADLDGTPPGLVASNCDQLRCGGQAGADHNCDDPGGGAAPVAISSEGSG